MELDSACGSSSVGRLQPAETVVPQNGELFHMWTASATKHLGGKRWYPSARVLGPRPVVLAWWRGVWLRDRGLGRKPAGLDSGTRPQDDLAAPLLALLVLRKSDCVSKVLFLLPHSPHPLSLKQGL